MKKIFIVISILFIAFSPSLSLQAQEHEEGGWIPKNQFAISGGIGWLGVAQKPNLSPWGKAYNKELKIASEVGLRYSRLWQRNDKSAHGIGMKFTLLQGDADYILEGSDIPVMDKIFLTYLAPQYVNVTRLRKVFQVGIHVGIGYLNYHNNGTKNGMECVTNGSGIGGNASTTWSYLITPRLAIGAEIGITTGYIWKLHQNDNRIKTTIDLDEKYKFNPSHFDSMILLHYYL